MAGNDSETSLETFGGYIHTYKFNEGVRDGVVLDLRYEARDIPQDITSQDRIDAWFDAKTVGLTPRAKAKLKAHWGNLQKVFLLRLFPPFSLHTISAVYIRYPLLSAHISLFVEILVQILYDDISMWSAHYDLLHFSPC